MTVHSMKNEYRTVEGLVRNQSPSLWGWLDVAGVPIPSVPHDSQHRKFSELYPSSSDEDGHSVHMTCSLLLVAE